MGWRKEGEGKERKKNQSMEGLFNEAFLLIYQRLWSFAQLAWFEN